MATFKGTCRYIFPIWSIWDVFLSVPTHIPSGYIHTTNLRSWRVQTYMKGFLTKLANFSPGTFAGHCTKTPWPSFQCRSPAKASLTTRSLWQEKCIQLEWTYTSWWFNQRLWKILTSNWIISPGRGQNKKYPKGCRFYHPLELIGTPWKVLV